MTTTINAPAVADFEAMERLLNAVIGSTAVAKAALQTAQETATTAYEKVQELDDAVFNCEFIEENLIDQYNSLANALENINAALTQIDPDLSRVRGAVAAARVEMATVDVSNSSEE